MWFSGISRHFNLEHKYYNLWGNCSFIFRIYEGKEHEECFKWYTEEITVNGSKQLKLFSFKEALQDLNYAVHFIIQIPLYNIHLLHFY